MVWFKNALIYPVTENQSWQWSEIEQQMEAHLYSPCSSQQQVSMGWVPAIPDTQNLIHVNGTNALMCLQRQERLLPSTVVNEVLGEKVALIQANEDRRVGSKEKANLKDEVIFELLPKAFVRTTRHYLYINSQDQVVVVNAASEKRGDEITSFLRETLGSLPISLLSSECQPSAVLTHWLANPEQAPEQLSFQPEVELTRSDNDDVKVRVKNLDLDGDELKMHLDQNGVVQQLAFEWQEKIQAVINAKSQIKRIKFSDLLAEQALNDSGDDKVSQFDASFMLMASELSQLIQQLRDWFSIRTEAQ